MSYKNDEYVPEHPKNWRHLYILNISQLILIDVLIDKN